MVNTNTWYVPASLLGLNKCVVNLHCLVILYCTCVAYLHGLVIINCTGVNIGPMGGSQKRCTKGGDHVRECIIHLLSIKNSIVDDFHVSIAINI